MTSPIGHTCAALALGRLGNQYRTNWRWLVFAVVSANAADLDFLPGLLAGDINRWHHGVSHSILAAVIWGGVTWLVLRSRLGSSDRLGSHNALAAHLGLVAGIIYASHLLLDFFTQDSRAPHGIPLLWPINEHYTSSVSLFGGIMHGVPGDDFNTVFWSIFSWHNAMAAIREVAIVSVFSILVHFALVYFAQKERLNGN